MDWALQTEWFITPAVSTHQVILHLETIGLFSDKVIILGEVPDNPLALLAKRYTFLYVPDNPLALLVKRYTFLYVPDNPLALLVKRSTFLAPSQNANLR